MVRLREEPDLSGSRVPNAEKSLVTIVVNARSLMTASVPGRQSPPVQEGRLLDRANDDSR
jgi:hypothetical protein